MYHGQKVVYLILFALWYSRHKKALFQSEDGWLPWTRGYAHLHRNDCHNRREWHKQKQSDTEWFANPNFPFSWICWIWMPEKYGDSCRFFWTNCARRPPLFLPRLNETLCSFTNPADHHESQLPAGQPAEHWSGNTLQRDISNKSTWFMIAMLIISVNIMIPSIVIIMKNKRHNNMTYSYKNHFINNNMTSQ